MPADDISLIFKNMASVELAIQEFQAFLKSSGLQLNFDNTEIIPIGSNATEHPKNNLAYLKSKLETAALKPWKNGFPKIQKKWSA